METLNQSLPVRGAWIEISSRRRVAVESMSSLPVRGAWIEMLCDFRAAMLRVSLPVRGAWIEMAT